MFTRNELLILFFLTAFAGIGAAVSHFQPAYPDLTVRFQNNAFSVRKAVSASPDSETVLKKKSVSAEKPGKISSGTVNINRAGLQDLMTKINGGYVYQSLTPKGEALTKLGAFGKATPAQVSEAKTANDALVGKCQEKLKKGTIENAQKVRGAFKNEEMWEHLAKDCFSCGTCNIVCPTCYCFDVQDQWNLDQVSGVRTRSWDSCLTEDFAKGSLGPTGAENFREERSERFRHRFMRKTTYLNNNLGGPACVGCGRCSIGCVPDIADPVKVITHIVEA